MKNLFKIFLAVLSSFFFSFSALAGGHYTGPDLSGQKVVMFGPWLSPEQEIMREVGAIFEKATGATFEYGGSDSFEQQVMIDLKAGSAADLVVFPQPGLAANAAAASCFAKSSRRIDSESSLISELLIASRA